MPFTPFHLGPGLLLGLPFGRRLDLPTVLGLDQSWSVGTVVAASGSGVALHIVLDSILYADMQPFFPLAANPFLGLASLSAVYFGCTVAGVVGVVLSVV